jgi:spheroidene monooxygenase
MPLARTTTPGASKSRSVDARRDAPAQRVDAAAPAVVDADTVVVVVLADIAPRARLWGWWRIVAGPSALRGTAGLRFAKVLGSGHEGGFGLRPSASRHGLFLEFADATSARAFAEQSPLMASYRRRSRELCLALLEPLSCRGHWSGHALPVRPPPSIEPAEPPTAGAAAAARPAEAASCGRVAALTRASIRPSRAWAFWRLAPAAEASLAAAAGCRLAVGLGEAPVLRQATFSLWDSVQAMQRYAHTAGHGQAVRAAYGEGHFQESMFARFRVLHLEGRWHGQVHG